jgi:hypothetical protein
LLIVTNTNPSSPYGLRRGRLSPFYQAEALEKADPASACAWSVPPKAGKLGEGE